MQVRILKPLGGFVVKTGQIVTWPDHQARQYIATGDVEEVKAAAPKPAPVTRPATAESIVESPPEQAVKPSKKKASP